MLEDVTNWDIAALVAFLVIWIGYGTVVDGRLRRPNSINARMITIREVWMARMLRRDMRMADAALMGHSIRSATFFASTTLLLLAGLVGVLSSADQIYAATANLSVLLRSGSLALFEVKVLLLIGIFVYGFFKFTWAIRQFNYFSAIIGAAPEPGPEAEDPHLPSRMGILLTHAFWQFNAGVRAYYFALAALGWFIHPILFIGSTVLIAAVLIHRQVYSKTAHDIADHADVLSQQLSNE